MIEYLSNPVFWIGLGQITILLQRCIELVVIQQCLGQCAHGVHIARLHVGSALIRRDGVLVAFQLVIRRAQRELHLAGAVRLRNRLNHLCRMSDVAALRIKAGHVQHHLF